MTLDDTRDRYTVTRRETCTVPVFRVFRTARWIFYTNLQKYLLDFLLLSELIAIFANEFQVLLREGVRFNDSNLVKGAFDIILH